MTLLTMCDLSLSRQDALTLSSELSYAILLMYV